MNCLNFRYIRNTLKVCSGGVKIGFWRRDIFLESLSLAQEGIFLAFEEMGIGTLILIYFVEGTSCGWWVLDYGEYSI